MIKRFVEPILMVSFLAVVGALAVQGLHEIEAQTRKAAGKSLQTVLQTTEEAIHFWAQTRIKDAQVLASSSEVVGLTEQLLALPSDPGGLIASEPQKRLRIKISSEFQRLGYRGFFVIAPDNVNLASIRDVNVGSRNIVALHRPDLMEQIFEGRSVIVPSIISDVPLVERAGGRDINRATMFAMAPIRNGQGLIIAAFAIRMDPVRDFSALTRLGRIGVSGETYAFNKDGYMLTNSRFDEQLRKIGLIDYKQRSVLTVRIADPGGNMVEGHQPVSRPDQRPLTIMASHAIDGGAGWNTDGYRDYRGVEVFGAWLWNRDLGMGLTTEIDADEALQSFYFARKIIVAGLAVTALLSIMLAGYLMVTRARALRDMEKSKEALETRANERTQDLMRINEKLQDQIIERARAEEQLKHAHAALEETNRKLEGMAATDGLTGIANRRAFDQHLKAEWNRCLRTKKPISLVLLDVDFFKRYNDAYGHQTGDECLQQISEVLRSDPRTRRPGDLVARYGGEEFGVILGETELDIATDTAEQIRTDISALAIVHEDTLVPGTKNVTISAGIASIVPRPGGQVSALIEAADRALYAAKEQGRDRVVSAPAPGATDAPPHLRPVPTSTS